MAVAGLFAAGCAGPTSGANSTTTSPDVISTSTTAGPFPGTTAAGHPQTWGRQVVNPGSYRSLTETSTGIYAVQSLGHRQRSQVVRLDPTTGRIVARSAVILAASAPVASIGRLWVTGQSAGAGPGELYRLDPTTLHTVSNQALWTPGFVNGITADAHHLWIAAGCTLGRLDPVTGRSILRRDVPGDPCGARSLLATGGSLFTTVLSSTGKLLLQQRDVATGLTTHSIDVPERFPGGLELVGAGADELWSVGGIMGDYGYLYWYGTQPLRLRGRTYTDGPPLARGQARLPVLGEFPSIDLSGKAIWAAGTGVIACLDPTTGRVRATTTESAGPIVSGPVVVIPSATWAIAIDTGNSPTGIVRLDAPASCEAT